MVKERGPGSWTKEDLFLDSQQILTTLGSRIQNLALRLAGISGGESEMGPARLGEEKGEIQELARELGYLNDGGIDPKALQRDWEVIRLVSQQANKRLASSKG